MTDIEQELKNVVLKTVKFTIDNKTIRSGRIDVFNTKQFFIKFKLSTGDEQREYEMPYPYKLIKLDNGYIFDYCLSSFCSVKDDNYFKMLGFDKTNASKLHNNYVYMVALSS
jgi:hypothetical protein